MQAFSKTQTVGDVADHLRSSESLIWHGRRINKKKTGDRIRKNNQCFIADSLLLTPAFFATFLWKAEAIH